MPLEFSPLLLICCLSQCLSRLPYQQFSTLCTVHLLTQSLTLPYLVAHPVGHAGLRLSQPAVPVLRHHRGSPPRAGRRWQAWPCRAHPNLSLSGVPHDLHCPAPHTVVPPENPFPSGRHGAHRAGRRAKCFRGRTGLRLPSGDYYYLTDSCWRACSDLARAFLPQPAHSTSAVGPLLRTRLCKATQILWLWLAIDPLTKIIPVLELGPRTQKTAHVFIHSLRQSLAAFLSPCAGYFLRK
jgi:hypothetical protein